MINALKYSIAVLLALIIAGMLIPTVVIALICLNDIGFVHLLIFAGFLIADIIALIIFFYLLENIIGYSYYD